MVIIGASALFFNSQAKADGVILIKDYPNQSLHGWKAFSFRNIERFSISYTVTLTTGQQQVFTTDRVVTILQEPKWEELILTSDTDWKNLDLQKSKLLASAAQFPQLKVWAQEMALRFDSYLTQNSPSTVVYQGKLISKDDYNKLKGLDSPNHSGKEDKSTLPELTIGSVTLTNVKLKSVNQTRVSLVHSNGIQGYSLADLKDDEISLLSRAFPAFAEHVKELIADASAGGSASKAPTSVNDEKQDSKDSNSMTLSQALASAQLKKESLAQTAMLLKETELAKGNAGSSKAMIQKEIETAKATDLNRGFDELLKAHEAEAVNTRMPHSLNSELAREKGVLVIKGLYSGMPFQHVWPALSEKYQKKFVLKRMELTDLGIKQIGYAIITLNQGKEAIQGKLFLDSKEENLQSFNFGVPMLVDLFKLGESKLNWEDFVQVFINEYGIPKMEGTKTTDVYTTVYNWSYLAKDLKVTISNHAGLTVSGISSSAFGD